MNIKSILLFLLVLPLSGWAQGFLSHGELGVNYGAMNYIGDLNNQSMLGKVNPGHGMLIRYNFDDRWSVTLGGAYGYIEGGNPDHIQRRNLSFKSYIMEGNVRAEFNFLPFGMTANQWRWTPYLFGGVGVFGFNPQASYIDPLDGEEIWVDLQPLGTEGQGTEAYADRKLYSLKGVNVPFGLGVRVKPFKQCVISVEYGFRKTFSDYLDDCSTTYVGGDFLIATGGSNGTLAAQMADRSGEVVEGYVNAPGIKRGDDSLDDWYAYMNISATISMEVLFGWMTKKKCIPREE